MTRLLTGFVLAGGRSSRMGTDKALLHLPDGESMIEHSFALLSAIAPEVRLLGSREKYSQLAWAGELVEDIYPGQGPLGGIHAALASTDTDLNIILAVDMPAMTVACLEYIVGRAESSSALVVVPEIGGRQQPLCAVYRRGFANIAEESLLSGRNKVAAAFVPTSTLVLTEDELRGAGFPAALFENMNTKEEWIRYKGDPQV